MVANTLIAVTVLFALSLGDTMAQSSSGSAAPELDPTSPSPKTQARAIRSSLAPTKLARRDGRFGNKTFLTSRFVKSRARSNEFIPAPY